nr:MAG TPA: hypothetical protein [Caudoviricetes sp.]DAH95931.1 MAG TPA: hypothetical protein [Caudoviricetes sp.]
MFRQLRKTLVPLDFLDACSTMKVRGDPAAFSSSFNLS